MTKMSVVYLGDLRTESTHESGAKIQTDAPKDNMGKGEAFSPTDLFALSLGTCMITLMGITARKLGVDIKGTSAEVEKTMVLAPHRRVGQVIIHIRSEYNPDEKNRLQLEKSALECPVHYSLHPDIKVDVDFTWGS